MNPRYSPVAYALVTERKGRCGAPPVDPARLKMEGIAPPRWAAYAELFVFHLEAGGRAPGVQRGVGIVDLGVARERAAT